jgi:hypothetical protein
MNTGSCGVDRAAESVRQQHKGRTVLAAHRATTTVRTTWMTQTPFSSFWPFAQFAARAGAAATGALAAFNALGIVATAVDETVP